MSQMDIVERLRRSAVLASNHQILSDAADQIDALRARIAAVDALHRRETVRLWSQACRGGYCVRDGHECEAGVRVYDVCRHCYDLALEIDDETSRWDEVASWPCATAIALGHPPKETTRA